MVGACKGRNGPSKSFEPKRDAVRRPNKREANMRKLLLLGTIAIVLSFGVVNGQAGSLVNQAPSFSVELDRQADTGVTFARERLAASSDSGDAGSIPEAQWSGEIVRKNVLVLTRRMGLFGIMAMGLALAAVSVRATSILHPDQFRLFGGLEPSDGSPTLMEAFSPGDDAGR